MGAVVRLPLTTRPIVLVYRAQSGRLRKGDGCVVWMVIELPGFLVSSKGPKFKSRQFSLARSFVWEPAGPGPRLTLIFPLPVGLIRSERGQCTTHPAPADCT